MSADAEHWRAESVVVGTSVLQRLQQTFEARDAIAVRFQQRPVAAGCVTV